VTALKLMSFYRLRIDEIKEDAVVLGMIWQLGEGFRGQGVKRKS
jgi:hypothetical protein